MPTTAKDRLSSLVDDIVANLGNLGVSLTQEQIIDTKRVAGDWIDSSQYKTISLAANKPDYNQILLQFQNALEHEEAWRDTLTAGGGQAILRFVSAAIAYGVFAQERATQERFMTLSRLPSSIYAGARSLGVRITRRRPSSATVSLTRTGSEYLLIPAFTLFTVGTTKFFNRTAIVFAKGDVYPVEAELVQGEIFSDTYKSQGVPFASYEVGSGDGSISEDDVYLFINGQQYTRVLDAFFSYGANDTVFYENTLHNGNVEVITGSGNFGAMPPSNADIKITYATTLGAEANLAAIELPVQCPSFPEVQGVSTTTISGGLAPPDIEFYRNNAPHMRLTTETAHRRAQFEVAAVTYPTIRIRDARVIGQQEIAPNVKAWQGVIKISALTDLVMDDKEWAAFAKYIQGKGIEGFHIVREDPIALPLTIQVKIGMTGTYGLEAARLAAKSALSNNYAPRQGILGLEFKRTDIERVLLRSSDPALQGGIDWVEVILPTTQSAPAAWNEYFYVDALTVDVEYSTRQYVNRLTN